MLSDRSYENAGYRVRALIADDSRIVRATLTKHLNELFAFSEAQDGEEAWEALLRDQDIALLITDLTMPRLDGYGLLQRMRSSRAQRLREMPVVVLSGADEPDERRLAREAGATDLITKGMATVNLVSRLDLLAQLVVSQNQYQCDLDLALGTHSVAGPALPAPFAFQAEIERRLGFAVRQQENFALISLCFHADPHARKSDIRQHVAHTVRQVTRQADLLAHTGDSELTIVTGSVPAGCLRVFASRLWQAVCQALQTAGAASGAVVCCGTASLSEFKTLPPPLHELWAAARRRSVGGLRSGFSGVIGVAEETVPGGM